MLPCAVALLILLCCVAFAAIDGSVVLGLERNFCFLAAACTDCSEKFFLRSGCALSCISAVLASLRFVLEALLCIEFLLTSRENKLSAAFFAY